MWRLRAVIRKEFTHLIRDVRTLMLISLLPLMELVIYGYAINTDVKHMSTVLFDEDHSAMSRRLVDAFEQSNYFDIRHVVQSPTDMRLALDRGWAKVALHIPPEFSKQALAGQQAKVQMIIDGTDSNPANTAMNTSQAIANNFIQQEGLVPVQVTPIDFRPRLWYNPDLKSSFFMIPGLVGLLIQLLIPMSTANAVVREKEHGNFEQLLVTPIKPYEFMVGKLVPYIAVGVFMGISVLGAAYFLFQVPIRGSIFTLFTLTVLFIIVCLGLGLLISTVADNQQQAGQMVILLSVPSVLLSGFVFPIETIPFPISYLSYILPLTYYLQIVRGIILKGIGFMDLWTQTLPLIFMAIFVMTVSSMKLRKRLK